MILDQGPRQTGRTTKLLLSVARDLALGKRVVVIAPSAIMRYTMIERLYKILDAAGMSLRENFSGAIEFDISGGGVMFTSPDNMMHALKGRTMNAYYVDGGTLETEEFEVLIPHLGNVDCNHFETEYSIDDFEVVCDEPEHDAPRRTLSSR